ncbi:MAG TPA: hypothetical protein VF898_06625, partial [Chloroflexota bacterium]
PAERDPAGVPLGIWRHGGGSTMSKEVSTPLVVVVLVVLVVIIGVFGFKALRSPKSDMTPEQQKESMRHMLPPNK